MSMWAVAIGAIATVGAGAMSADAQRKAANKQTDAMNALANRPQNTALGSFFNPGSTSGLAPSIQNQRADLTAQLPGYKSILSQGFNTFSGNLQNSRAELAGNESQFMQSSLNPLRQRQASAEGSLTRDLSRRGIEGSSFANTARGNQQATFGRQLSDATAQTRNLQLAQRLGIDEAQLNASTGFINNLASLDQQQQSNLAQQAAEQLSLLGLSADQIGNMLQVSGLKLQTQQNYYNQLGRLAMGVGGQISDAGQNQANQQQQPPPTTSPFA